MDLTVDHLALTQCFTFAFSHTNQADSASEDPSAFLAVPELREIKKRLRIVAALPKLGLTTALFLPRGLPVGLIFPFYGRGL